MNIHLSETATHLAPEATYFDFEAGGGGGGGAGFGIGARPPKVSINTVGTTSLVGLGAGDGLLFGMTYESFRNRLWQTLFEADYQVRFWKSYEAKAAWISKIVKAILMLGSIFALVAFMSWPGHEKLVLGLSVVTGLISSVIIPAFGLEGFVEKVFGLRSRWIDVRDGLQAIWDEVDIAEEERETGEAKQNFSRAQKEFDRWKKVIKELEQFDGWLPKPKKMRSEIYAETEKFLLPST